MSRYIFFARTIRNVGGAQLFLNAKVDYLASQGWDVRIVYDRGGEAFLPKLDNYPGLLIEELDRPAFMYLGYRRKNIIRKITKFLGQLGEGDVIESHSQALSSWAELVAKEYGNVRHWIYELDERPEMPREMHQYYRFKYTRNELVGILEQSVSIFMQDTGLPMTNGSPFLPAYGAADCVVDVPSRVKIEKGGKYLIGVVGRLEKPYIWEYAKSAAEFVNQHPDKQFMILFIGGEPEGDVCKKRIEELFATISNVELLFTGYLFPIPRELVFQLDVCLAGAGAAYGISNEGIVTLPIDPRDFMCNGVMRVTTEDSVFSDKEKKTVTWWMEEVYNNPKRYVVPIQTVQHDFQSHLDYLNCLPLFIEYDDSFLRKRAFSLFVKSILCSILSVKNRERLSSIVRKIKI